MDARPARLKPAQALRDLGPLRLTLGLLALVLAALAPTPGQPTLTHGWGLITTGVLPALGPIVLAVLLLDLLMSRVVIPGGDPRRRLVGAYDLTLAVLLVAAWAPFLRYLFSL